jgi:hypothetical protein
VVGPIEFGVQAVIETTAQLESAGVLLLLVCLAVRRTVQWMMLPPRIQRERYVVHTSARVYLLVLVPLKTTYNYDEAPVVRTPSTPSIAASDVSAGIVQASWK